MGNGSSKTLPPDWVAKSLECPVCLEIIESPPIYLCEKGHGLCSACRQPLKDQDLPCPVCRGKLTDTRNFALENVLEQLPKVKCKYEGCNFQKSDAQQIKIHQKEECRERPVICAIASCQKPIAMSKLFGHLETKHGSKPLGYKTLGQEFNFMTYTTYRRGLFPLGKVNNDLDEFMINRKSYDEKIVMFWISLNGSTKEAKRYRYTLKLLSKEDRTKILASKSTECLSTAMSLDNVKRKATALFVTRDDMKEAETNNKKLIWTVVIEKK